MRIRTDAVAAKLGLVVLMVAMACLLDGCVADATSSGAPPRDEAKVEDKPGDPAAAAEAETSKPAAVDVKLSHGYTALHAMADKNQQLEKLLIIKSVSKPTEALVRRVSQVSADAAATIKDIEKTSPTITFGDDGVPAIDAAARDGIESDTRKTLIFDAGESFEIQLILAQIRAMQWGAQMADALAEQDPDKAHQQRMKAIGKQMAELRDALTKRLALAK